MVVRIRVRAAAQQDVLVIVKSPTVIVDVEQLRILRVTDVVYVLVFVLMGVVQVHVMVLAGLLRVIMLVGETA